MGEGEGEGGTAVNWLLADNEGTVRDMATYANGQTTIVAHIVYDAYGNIASQTNAAARSRMAYTGQMLDAATGLYYHKARWYDSCAGDFLGEGPLGFAAGDANMARYVGNNPVNFTDPSGMAKETKGRVSLIRNKDTRPLCPP